MKPSNGDVPDEAPPAPAGAPESAPAEPLDYDAPIPHTRRRSYVAAALVGLTIAFVLGMASLVYLRWLTIEEPTTAVVVRGDASHSGATVLVTGDGTYVKVTLDEKNNFSSPVLLVPGSYTVTATLGGKILLRNDVTLKAETGLMVFLSEEARNGVYGAPPAN